jgi:cyanophycin synthetase
VMTSPGDRRDEDMREMCRIAAKGFDRVIVRQDDDTRGRDPMEVPKLMERALFDAGMSKDAVEIVAEEQQAVDRALRVARRGDLVVVLADKINRSWKQITKFKGEGEPARPSATALPADTEPDEALKLDGVVLVRDARGVRLAREAETED